MDISQLKRDTGRIFSALTIMPDKSVIANKPLVVHIPKRFEESGLAEIGDSVKSFSIIGIVVDNYYAAFCGLTWLELHPGDILETTIDDDRYLLLHFEPGDVVIERLRVAVDDMAGYTSYIEFIKYCRIPWYVTFEHICAAHDESKYYTGKSTGNSNQALRILYSIACRDNDNPDIPFRYGKGIKDPNVKPLVIGINNPGQLLSGIFSRLSGGYLADNEIGGILDKETKVTELERILKGTT